MGNIRAGGFVPEADDSDPTIRLRPAPDVAGRKGIRPAWLLAGVLAIAGIGGAAWLELRRPPPPPIPPAVSLPVPKVPAPNIAAPSVPAAPAAQPTPAPVFAIRTASEADIRDNKTDALTIFRFADNPRVLVLDFASLHEQAMMLNRVAALVEKAGLPHDRVLTDSELAAAIKASGDTPDTYYYGHDYSAAALARFFALAERDHITLTPQEQTLHALLAQEGYLQPGVLAALISIPQAGVDRLIDPTARATILHHELSHGEYFSNPVYAAYAQHFWRDVMTDHDRALFTHFLTSEDYDGTLTDLMINETQAYLMHTPDPRFFNATALGMDPVALNRLQAAFLLGMPPGWLRDCTTVPPLPIAR